MGKEPRPVKDLPSGLE